MVESVLSGATNASPSPSAGVCDRVVHHAGLDFRVLSAGQGAPLVLLHGGGSNAAHFIRLMVLLSRRFRVFAYDQRGFGKTGANSETPIDHAHWSNDVIAIMNLLGLRDAALIGWSMGATVALNTAARWPDRISRLFLLGAPNPHGFVDAAQARARLQRLTSMNHVQQRRFIRGELSNRIAQPSHKAPACLDRLVSQYLSTDLDLQARIIDAYANRPDLLRIVRQADCSAHVIVGADDQVTPLAAAKAMTAMLSDATLDVVAHCGHYYAEERPETVSAVIQRRMSG